MKKIKPAKASETIMTEVVCPNDTNPMGILQGGRLVQWMDIASAVSAQIHAERICVTASIDSVKFKFPAKVGDIITIKSKVTRSFNSSMEIFVQAWSKKVLNREISLICEAYFTFVAINDHSKPTAVPLIKAVSQYEKEEYLGAEKRKKARLNS